jgi:tetratricopeptide (TPR) repeat protein
MALSGSPLRVFISHTSELAVHPVGLSFRAAAEAAVKRLGWAPVDMTAWPAQDAPAAEVCRERVAGCDVFVLILGTRYGSVVREDPSRSHVELEFDAATAAGIPRLVFVVDEENPQFQVPRSFWVDPQPEFGARQQAFRAMVDESGLVRAMVSSPQDLTAKLTAALHQVPAGDVRPVRRAAGVVTSPDDVAVPAGGASNLPRRPSAVFVGRQAALEDVTRLFARTDPRGGVGGPGVAGQVISGLGGVGKSELALQYASRRLGSGAVVWWVGAETTEELELGFAELAFRLQPATATAASSGWTTTEAAAWAVGWLQAHTGWLVVLDNVEDLAVVEPTLGRLTTGDVLITTRRDLAWHRHGFTPIRLDVLTRQASIQLLRDTVLGSDASTGAGFDEAAAGVLAGELGDLPLALEQAGSYIAQQRISLPAYLARLRQAPGDVLARVAEGGRQARAVAQVWSITFDTLTERAPHAVPILHGLAWLAPDNLPRDVVSAPATTEAGEDDVDHLLGVLASYGLIRLTDTTVSIHRLLQTVLRAASGMDPQGRPDSRDAALSWLSAALPPGAPSENVEGWPRWRELLPHIEALVPRFPENQPDTSLASLLGRTGFYLSVQGRHLEALPLEQRALAITEAALGPDHRTTGTRLDSLALTLGDLGRHEEALPLQQRALAITEAALGADHRTTGTRLDNLASTLGALGRHEEALPLRQRALAITEAALGPDHPTTGTRLNNLGATLGALGRHQDALPLRERALAITEAALGPDHPTTGTRLNNLASALAELGRHQDALPLRERALAITETALGPDHPTTGTRLDNLAHALGELGRHEEALPLRQRALAITEAALGPDHPDTGLRLNNLAYTLGKLGRHQEALPLRQRAQKIPGFR